MSISISGSTALSGLSGMDTNFDTTLEQLYSVEKTQLNQLEAWKSDWKLRYDAFNTVIDQMSAAKEMLATIGSVNNFVSKNTSSSDESVVTLVAAGSATDGTHKISVSQVANNAVWCNTGAVFNSKTDIINETDQPVTFAFDYAGKHCEFEVAQNTTLESFVSLINNSSLNPGVTMSVVNTGQGYVYQIAGKDTGASNALTIYSCALKGMETSSETTSIWKSDVAYALDDPIENPTEYTYTAILEGGEKVSVSLAGNKSVSDLASALQNSAGSITPTYDSAHNLLSLKGVRSLTRSSTVDDASTYTPASYQLSLGNRDDPLISADSTTDLTVKIELYDDNGNRTDTSFTISGSATKRNLAEQIAQAVQSSAQMGLDDQGSFQISYDGIASISIDDGDLASTNVYGLSGQATAASDIKPAFSSSVESAKATITFDQTKLSSNFSDPEKSLQYTLVKADGSLVTLSPITMQSGETNQNFLDKLKTALGAKGANYSVSQDADGNTVLELSGFKDFYLSSGSTTTDAFSTKYEITSQIKTVAPNGDALNGFYKDPVSNVTYLEEAPKLSFSLKKNDGTEISVSDIPSGSSMRDIYQKLKAEIGADVSLVDAAGNTLDDTTQDAFMQIKNAFIQIKNIETLSSPVFSGQIVSSSNWSITNASNAIYSVDNWPMELQSESNTISDLLDGVSLSLTGVGDASFTVSTDIASVETSIQNFLDAVNSVIITIRDLTAVDEDKEVTTNDPNNADASNYSKSTLTAEKGGLLTGNYGVQLVKSRFMSVVTGTPPGFQAMTTADDMLSGDILSCLANMGIKTDTDTTSSTYGLLVQSPRSDFLQEIDEANYKDMINNHVSELVDFFVSSGKGTSTSADFRYNSHVAGVTTAGTYDVSYKVENGAISEVLIGGERCIRDGSRGGYYYTCVSGAARGLSISIDNLNDGEHSGQIRIKQGLVQTVQYFLEKELKYNSVNVNPKASDEVIAAQLSLKSENGAMMTLKANYATIMENIDTAIEREQRRLSTWYTRQKKTFANLETLLRTLNEQQTSLEGQLKQLSGNK